MDYFRNSLSSITSVFRSGSFLRSSREKLPRYEENHELDQEILYSNVIDVARKMVANEGIILSRSEIESMYCYFNILLNENKLQQQDNVLDNITNRLGNSPGKFHNPFVDFLQSHYTKSFPNRSSASPWMELNSSSHHSLDGDASDLDEEEDCEEELKEILLPELDIQQLLNFNDWNYDIFPLINRTTYALVIVTETAIHHYDLLNKLEISPLKLRKFLKCIQDGYQNVPYHNYIHAADVTHTIVYMGTTGNLFNGLGLTSLQILGMIISAAIHDVNHPGQTGKFLVSTLAPLAITYNDESPLENMHLATAFQLWLKPENNFTKNMPKTNFMELRKLIVDLVLATDNDQHFDITEKVETIIQAIKVQTNVVNTSTAGTRSSLLRLTTDHTITTTSSNTIMNSYTNNSNMNGTYSASVQNSPYQLHTNTSSMNSNGSLESPKNGHSHVTTTTTTNNTTGVSATTSGHAIGYSTPTSNSYRNDMTPHSASTTATTNTITGLPPNTNTASATTPTFTSSGSVHSVNSTSSNTNTTAPRDTVTSRLSIVKEKSLAPFRRSSIPVPNTSHTADSTASSGTVRTPRLARVSTSRASYGYTVNMAENSPGSRPNTTRRDEDGTSINSVNNIAPFHKYNNTQILTLMKASIHLADISNPAKPWDIYKVWIPKIMEEFYAEGDKQRELGLPITFAFDRQNPTPQHVFQLGFMKVIVSPLYTAISKLPNIHLDTCVNTLQENMNKWKEIADYERDESSKRFIQPPIGETKTMSSTSITTGTTVILNTPSSILINNNNTTTATSGSGGGGGGGRVSRNGSSSGIKIANNTDNNTSNTTTTTTIPTNNNITSTKSNNNTSSNTSSTKVSKPSILTSPIYLTRRGS